jgi:UDP-galactopyranose mutase
MQWQTQTGELVASVLRRVAVFLVLDDGVVDCAD